MGEGRENNCIWQKNIPGGQESALGSQPLASDCACHWQGHALSKVSSGQYTCRRGFQLLGGGGKATGPTQEATAVC